MKTWLTLLVMVVALVAILLVMCVVLSVGLTWIGVWITDHGAKKNAKAVCKLLPNTDCGQCGCESCMDYAQLVADFRCEQGQCPYVTPEINEKVKDLFYVPPVSEKKKLMDLIRNKKND